MARSPRAGVDADRRRSATPRRACATIDAWLDANPPGVGINWASSVEVALRDDFVVLDADAAARIARSVTGGLAAANARRASGCTRRTSGGISRTTARRNTDLTGEALGLFYAATLFPEFREADALARGRRPHARRPKATRRSAGTACTSSSRPATTGTASTRICTSCCWPSATASTLPEHVRDRVQQMVEFLRRDPPARRRRFRRLAMTTAAACCRCSGRSPCDARGLFARGRGALPPARLRVGGRRPRAGGGVADGRRRPATRSTTLARRRRQRTPLACSPRAATRRCAAAGTPDAHQAIVDIGPIGCPVSGGHGHADLLSIQCSIFGEPCLVDAGHLLLHRRAAVARLLPEHRGAQHRDRGRRQPGRAGRRRSAGRGSRASGCANGIRRRNSISSTPSTTAICRLPDPVVHRRRVIFVKPGYWILVDDLSGAARHQIDLTFQFGSVERRSGHSPVGARRDARRAGAVDLPISLGAGAAGTQMWRSCRP